MMMHDDRRRRTAIRIRTMMQVRDMRIGAVATASRLTEGAVTQFIEGKAHPSAIELVALSMGLGCTIGWLMEGAR